jgi:hypothetical protein
MDNIQIEHILFRYPRIKNCFIGVYSSDTMPCKQQTRSPYCFIANTAKSTESGEHWVAFFVPDGTTVQYFDSYGTKPFVDSFKRFVRSFPNFTYNDVPLQGYSTMCGQYCTLFLIARQYGHPFQTIIDRFHSGEGRSLLRDISVCSIVNNLAGLRLPLIDPDLLPPA